MTDKRQWTLLSALGCVVVLVAGGGHAWHIWAHQLVQALPLLEPI